MTPTLREPCPIRYHQKKTGHKPLIRLATERQTSNSSSDGSDGSEGYYSGSDSDISFQGSLEPYREKTENSPQNRVLFQNQSEHYKKQIELLIEEVQRLRLHDKSEAFTLFSIPPSEARSDFKEQSHPATLPPPILDPSPIFYSFHSLSDNERMEKLANLFTTLNIEKKTTITDTVTMLDVSNNTSVKSKYKQTCSKALTAFVNLTDLLTRGAIFIGGSILIFYYPNQTVQATILVADPTQTSPYTGRVVDYSLCNRNYLATSIRFVLIVTLPIIDSFVLKLSEIIRDRCNKLFDRHICNGEDCIFTQGIHGQKTCLLRDMTICNFIKTVKRLDKDQQIIVLCFLSTIPNEISFPMEKLPHTATAGEIVENLIVQRDWRYFVHSFSYAAYCTLAGVYIILGNHLETAVIALVADATIEQNNTDIFANQTQQSLSVTGNVTSFTPKLAPYLVSTISLFAAYYLTPKVLPLVQRGGSYLYNKYSSRKSYRKRRYSPSWA